MRVDGHTIIEADYVRQCVDALQRSGADNAGGRMDPVGSTSFGKAVALATKSPFGVGGARFHYSTREEWVDTVYLGAWPRRVFERIGGFDEEQVRNQDDELNYRLRGYGGKILLSPLIRSTYFNRSTLPALWRQYFQYGFWKVRVMQKHARQMQVRQLVPSAFVLGLVILAALAAFVPLSRIAFAGFLGIYVAAALAAAVLVAGNKERRLAPLVIVACAVLHLGYGTGFLWGLVRFRRSWRNRPAPQIPKFAQ